MELMLFNNYNYQHALIHHVAHPSPAVQQLYFNSQHAWTVNGCPVITGSCFATAVGSV